MTQTTIIWNAIVAEFYSLEKGTTRGQKAPLHGLMNTHSNTFTAIRYGEEKVSSLGRCGAMRSKCSV